MATEYLNNKSFEKIIARFQQSKRDKVKYELIIEELKETKKRKSKRKTSINREKTLLKSNQSTYQNVMTDHTQSQSELAAAFYTLSENIVRYAKFHNIDPEDAIQEGVLICFDKIDRFDPVKGKAFNYMTTCILNHFRQLYRTARNYNELKKKYLKHLQMQINQTLIRNGREVMSYSIYGSNDGY